MNCAKLKLLNLTFPKEQGIMSHGRHAVLEWRLARGERGTTTPTTVIKDYLENHLKAPATSTEAGKGGQVRIVTTPHYATNDSGEESSETNRDEESMDDDHLDDEKWKKRHSNASPTNSPSESPPPPPPPTQKDKARESPPPYTATTNKYQIYTY